MKKLYILLFLISTVFAFGQSNYLVENFDYTADDLLTGHGWYEHSGTGTNIISVNNGGLSFTGYIGSAVGNSGLVDNTGSDENKPFAVSITSGSVYASFLVKANAEVTGSNDGYFFHFVKYSNETTPDYTDTSSTFRARTYIVPGSGTGFFRLGLTFNSGTIPTAEGTDTTGDLDVTKTYLVVVKYTFVDGATNDNVSLFVFEDGVGSISTEGTPSIGPVTGSGSDIGTIQGIALRQFSGNENVLVDGFYVRTEWNMEDAGTTLSTINFTKSELAIYPNPANGLVIIKSTLSGAKNIELFDITGRRVSQQVLESETLDLKSINPGMYLLKVSIENKSSVTKLIVE